MASDNSVDSTLAAPTAPTSPDTTLGDVVDKTPAQFTPADFDISSFLDGVRPYRRSVRLRLRGDLVARLDEIVQEIEDLPEDEPADDLIDEYERLRDEYTQGTWFTVEQRSVEWINKMQKSLPKELGIKVTKDEAGNDVMSEEDTFTFWLHRLAAQVVVPSDVTGEKLRTIAENCEPEFLKLASALNEVNSRQSMSSEP